MLLRTYQSNNERVVKLQRTAVTTELSTAMERNAIRSFRLIVTAAAPPFLECCGLLRNEFVPDAVDCLKPSWISWVILNFLAQVADMCVD